MGGRWWELGGEFEVVGGFRVDPAGSCGEALDAAAVSGDGSFVCQVAGAVVGEALGGDGGWGRVGVGAGEGSEGDEGRIGGVVALEEPVVVRGAVGEAVEEERGGGHGQE